MLVCRTIDTRRHVATGVVVCMSLVATGLAGCGGPRGPQRYRLSGRVTFDGKPLPQGQISFDPVDSFQFGDKRIGGGFAPIRDGVYSTDVYGRGHLGGPHRIVITGQAAEPVNDGSSEPHYPPLFDPYETTVDLPARTSTKEFTVPSPAP